MAKSKKYSTRAKKAWATRRKNAKADAKSVLEIVSAKGYKIGDIIDGPILEINPEPGPAVNLGSTMELLERSIDELIERINTQTNRIRDMM